MNDVAGHRVSLKFPYLLLLCAAHPMMSACSPSVETLSSMQTEVAEVLTAATVQSEETRTTVPIEMGFAAAINAAVEANRSYQAASALHRQAISGIDVASSARRPQISGNATIGGVREGGDVADTQSGAAGGITLSQLLYDAGESAAQINQATAEAIAAHADLEATANAVALDAANAWIDVWQYRERLALLHSRTGEMQEILTQIERMAEHGVLDRAMLDDARRQVVGISLEESRLQSDLRQAQVRFARLFNVRDARVGRPQDIIPLAVAQQEALRWEDAPTLRRNAAELLVARNGVIIAQAALRPRARLQAGVTSPMDDEDTTDTSVGVTLEYTFGDGGRRRSQLEASQARLEAASAELAERQLALEAELEAAVAQLEAIQRSMPLLNENIRISQTVAETARSQIATGQSNLRQLVDAEIESYRSRDQQIAMQAERMMLQLTIAARTGALARAVGLNLSGQQ